MSFSDAVFVVLGSCIAVQMGTHPDWIFFCCFVGIFMFYCAHWQTYVSGTLRFGMWVKTLLLIIIDGTCASRSVHMLFERSVLLMGNQQLSDSCCTVDKGLQKEQEELELSEIDN